METLKDFTNMDKLAYTKYIESENFVNKHIAISLSAQNVHEKVNQDYDGKPYYIHLNAVASYTFKYIPLICEKEEDVLPVLFGAYFHDSIEDARLTYNDVMKIAKGIMSDEQAYMAAEIVYALTNEKGRNRHERANDKYYEGIRTTKYAPLVKAADRLANYGYAKSTHSRMEKCYRDEMKDFIKKALTAEDGTLLIPKEMVDELFS